MANFIWPFDPAQYESSPYGPRDGPNGGFHEGIDLAPPSGTPIPISGAGIVESNYYHPVFGNLVEIFHGQHMAVDSTAYRDIHTLYPHMLAPSSLSVGTPVTQAQIVGLVGNTGGSQGTHLHWEVHECPVGGPIVHNLNNDGGYRTAIDPYVFMARYSDGTGGPVDPPDPDPVRRKRRRDAWLNRPPGAYYRGW